MNNKICIVMTTIHDGHVLESYCKQYINQKDLIFVVIPDLKSPPALFEKCQELVRRGYNIIYPTIKEQEAFLDKLNFPAGWIPYNSDNRRNVGYLMALEQGSEVIISIDDDNYCIDSFKDHLIVTTNEITLPGFYSDNGWVNVCELLDIVPDCKIYPRGFPYKKRQSKNEILFREDRGQIRLNIGLWHGAPDVDALTWLIMPTTVKRFRGYSYLIGKDMWTPINTQNTALHRDLMVTYYYIKMGQGIDRFGDIFSGYFCQKCIQHMGDRIRVGTPITLHQRNTHDYMDDLIAEFKGILLLEEFVDWLQNVKLEGATYSETYLSLIHALREQIDRFQGLVWTKAVQKYFYHLTDCMSKWVQVCGQIN